MFNSSLQVPSALLKPAASNTFPVTWSMAGYPSAPNGAYGAAWPSTTGLPAMAWV